MTERRDAEKLPSCVTNMQPLEIVTVDSKMHIRRNQLSTSDWARMLEGGGGKQKTTWGARVNAAEPDSEYYKVCPCRHSLGLRVCVLTAEGCVSMLHVNEMFRLLMTDTNSRSVR